jgi:hypothetical protein
MDDHKVRIFRIITKLYWKPGSIRSQADPGKTTKTLKEKNDGQEIHKENGE